MELKPLDSQLRFVVVLAVIHQILKVLLSGLLDFAGLASSMSLPPVIFLRRLLSIFFVQLVENPKKRT
jgi:hypothetical protein